MILEKSIPFHSPFQNLFLLESHIQLAILFGCQGISVDQWKAPNDKKKDNDSPLHREILSPVSLFILANR
jgi:hypothetical protein